MQKINLWLLGRKGRGAIIWEIGIDIYTLQYVKQIINDDLVYSWGGTVLSMLQWVYMGKIFFKTGEIIYLCIYIYTHSPYTLNQLYPNSNFSNQVFFGGSLDA